MGICTILYSYSKGLEDSKSFRLSPWGFVCNLLIEKKGEKIIKLF